MPLRDKECPKNAKYTAIKETAGSLILLSEWTGIFLLL